MVRRWFADLVRSFEKEEEEEEEEENEVQKTPRGGVGEKKKRKLGGNFSLVRTVERG
jgi:hypothetical protein